VVVCIKNLRLSAILGVYDHERHAEREIIVNLRVKYDPRAALRTDALEDALDYKQIRDRIVSVVSGTRFKLIETLANGIVDELIKDSRILKLRLEVDKPQALRLTDSVSVIVRWERTRG
jgi:D-erythro-7,8-dihydroneopterin triphosphate epimerase